MSFLRSFIARKCLRPSIFAPQRKPSEKPARKPARRNGRGELVWRYDEWTVKARTKSEARARLKRLLGLKRLPVGAQIIAV